MKILNKDTGAVIYEDDSQTLFETLKAAIATNVSLYKADLSGVNLDSVPYMADLSGSYLHGAYLIEKGQKLTLIGERPWFSIVGIGSRRNNRCHAFITDRGVYVTAGSYFGTLVDVTNAVNESYGDGIHGKEYRAAIELIKVHAELWTPKHSS